MVTQKRYLEHMDLLNSYIRSIASRCRRQSILLGKEDLIQEASFVLWRVVKRYPKAHGEEIVKLFKVSFRRHLADLFGAKNRIDKMESLDNIGESIEVHVNLSSSGLLPWDYYRYHIRCLEMALGRKEVRDMIDNVSLRKARDVSFRKRKEAILRKLG